MAYNLHMAVGINCAHPVETFRDQSAKLEDALSACLEKPTPSAVHRLRTTIRRVEAQTKLLAQLRDLPPHARESRDLRKRLKKLRKLAGNVRDLDVQGDLISGKSTPDTAGEVKQLCRKLRSRRKDQAAILVDYGQQVQERVLQALESLNMSLRSLDQFELPNNELVMTTQRWFARRYSSPTSQSQLHATRKLAKLARYMLEIAQGSAVAKGMAKKFEDIQQKGGQWHDWLQLSATAAEMLEEKNPLIKIYRQERDAKLRRYRKALEEQPQRLVGSRKAA
jgi:CHAD domain-containing protein